MRGGLQFYVIWSTKFPTPRKKSTRTSVPRCMGCIYQSTIIVTASLPGKNSLSMPKRAEEREVFDKEQHLRIEKEVSLSLFQKSSILRGRSSGKNIVIQRNTSDCSLNSRISALQAEAKVIWKEAGVIYCDGGGGGGGGDDTLSSFLGGPTTNIEQYVCKR